MTVPAFKETSLRHDLQRSTPGRVLEAERLALLVAIRALKALRPFGAFKVTSARRVIREKLLERGERLGKTQVLPLMHVVSGGHLAIPPLSPVVLVKLFGRFRALQVFDNRFAAPNPSPARHNRMPVRVRLRVRHRQAPMVGSRAQHAATVAALIGVVMGPAADRAFGPAQEALKLALAWPTAERRERAYELLAELFGTDLAAKAELPSFRRRHAVRGHVGASSSPMCLCPQYGMEACGRQPDISHRCDRRYAWDATG